MSSLLILSILTTIAALLRYCIYRFIVFIVFIKDRVLLTLVNENKKKKNGSSETAFE